MIKTEENCNRRQRIANEESIEVSKTEEERMASRNMEE